MGDPVGNFGPRAVPARIKDLLRRVARLEKNTVGGSPRFNTVTATNGVRSPGVRTRTVTNSPVQLYVDADGQFGISASTRAKKNIGDDYNVDMQKFLAIVLKNWQYKDKPFATGMGPIADDLDAAGLTEFVIYNLDGTVQGVRSDMLIIGLWSAYKQSRTATLARIANQMHQVVTLSMGTALSLGGTRSYTVMWPNKFADADYHATASIYTSAGVLVAGASAAVLPSQRTDTGCTVQVSTSVALLATMNIIVEATHI